MKKLFFALFVLALSIFGGTAAMADPRGHKFCDTPLAPMQIAAKIEASLAQDASGNGDIVGCKAKPIDFFDAWKDEDTGMKSYKDLPAFLRSLVEIQVAPKTTVSSACVRHDYNGVIVHCMYREFEAGEKAWGKNGHIFLMGNCVNPVNWAVAAITVEGPCIRIDFPSTYVGPTKKTSQATRIAYIGAKPLPSTCLALKIAGTGTKLRGIPDECPIDVRYEKILANGRKVLVICSWEEIEAKVSENLGFTATVQNVSGSFYSVKVGTNSLWLPREALDGTTAICWEMPDGTFRTLGVSRKHVINGVATITPKQVEEAIYEK